MNFSVTLLASVAPTSRVLLDILIILVAAKVAAEVAERVKIPTVIGEIIAGVLIGPSVLGFVGGGDVLATLAELGVILLLLEVGMHMDLRSLGSVGKGALSVAVVGVVVPFAGGLALGSAFGLTGDQSLFVAAALTATSVGITARVFGDLKALASTEARTVLGAAVADDVIGLIILTIVVRVVTGTGSIGITEVAGLIALAVGFLVVCTSVGTLVAPRVFEFIDRRARSGATLVALALAFALGIAQLATLAKLAPLIGAFVAGLCLSRSSSASRIQRELTPVGHLFIPVFFLQIGINVDVASFAKGSVIGLAAAMCVVAVVGKVVAGWGAFGMRADKLTIGLGMIPRGEVGLIFASIGLASGVFDDRLYASLLIMVLFTTLITPPLLSWRSSHQRSAADLLLPPEPVNETAPAAGWLVAAGDESSLAGVPPRSAALSIAIATARGLDDGRKPTDELVSWLTKASSEPTPLVWTERTTQSFLTLLTSGSNRSWRFLETTGILNAALPEFATALSRRHLDPSVLDPSGVHRLPTVDRLRKLINGEVTTASDVAALRRISSITNPQLLLLVGFIIDISEGGNEVAKAHSVLSRLSLDADVKTMIGQLVEHHDLLAAAARRPGSLQKDAVLGLAAHIRHDDHLAQLYALAVALNGFEPWERAALDELESLLRQTLHFHGGSGSAQILDGLRSAASSLVGSNPQALQRIATAPTAYLLATAPSDVAADMRQLDSPRPKGGYVFATTLSLEQLGHGRQDFPIPRIRISLTGPDVVGLLSYSTGALEDQRLSIDDAVVASWSDGAALQIFTVTPAEEMVGTEPEALRCALDRNMRDTLQSNGVPDALVRFDNSSSPWGTICEIRATDRAGLLHSVTTAFAATGVDVHAARISTNEELAFDVFELTDKTGAKLSLHAQELVTTRIKGGVLPTKPSRNPFINTLGTQRKHRGSRAETTLP
jgi:Kef-type K+ transport system membrane component KefB